MIHNPFAGVLLDLDGTLAVGNDAIEGAVGAVRALRAHGLPLAIVTNTTRLSRSAVERRLASAGFDFESGRIFTVPAIAAAWLRRHGCRRALPILAQSTWGDLDPDGRVELVAAGPGPIDTVIVGDPGPELTFDALNAAFRAILGGARLLACQRNRYWLEPDGLSLDAGALVVALEYAAGVEAELVGKPAPDFFHLAADALGVDRGAVLMVGDDLEGDVRGAKAAGLSGCLVRTGKYREGDLSSPGAVPDLVLESVAQLPAALGITP